jgi:purine catabolism regulator
MNAPFRPRAPEVDLPDSAAIPEITVAEALELPVLRRGLPKVVAGARALDHPIRWVHAGEVPNIASLLGGGELLLTTGMGIGSGRAQREFVSRLASRGVAGVVIELGGVFKKRLPAALVEAAEEDGLPLVELRTPVRFVAVTETIHTEIVNRNFDLLRRTDALHREFTAAVVDGRGVGGVLELLANALANPVFFEGHDGRLLAEATPVGGTIEDLVTAWDDARSRADAAIEAPVAARGHGQDACLLAIPLERPFDTAAQPILERAAAVLALALMGSRHEQELLAVGHGQLLASLMNGRIDAPLAAERAADLGLGGRDLRGFLPVVARMMTRPRSDAGTSEVDSWTGTLREVERDIARVGAPTLVGIELETHNLLLLIGVGVAGDRAALADLAAKVLHGAAERAGREVAVAVAGVVDWDEVGSGLRDAVDAAAMEAGDGERGWADATSHQLDLLLWRLGDREELRHYVDKTIGPLIRYDAEHRRKLLPTLEALCAHGGRRAGAARDLHLNRQALYGRISKLESMLGVDLADVETLTALHVAFALRAQLRSRSPEQI